MTPKRWLTIFYCLGACTCVLWCIMLLLMEHPLRPVFNLGALLLLGVGLLLHRRRCRCPACDCHLRDLRFSTDYCSYCGSYLDPE